MGVSSLRFFVQSRDFLSPSPRIVQSPYPRDPLLSEPRVRSTGQKPLAPRLQVGRAVRTPQPRVQFPACETAGRPGLAGLTLRWRRTCPRPLPLAHLPGRGGGFRRVRLDVTGPLTRFSPGCAGAPLAGGINPCSFVLSLAYPGHPQDTLNCVCVVSLLQMKDLGAEYLAGCEGVQLFGLLNLYLEQEQRFQPREKGLSLIEATPEVSSQERYLAAAANGAWGGDFKNTCECIYIYTHRHIFIFLF